MKTRPRFFQACRVLHLFVVKSQKADFFLRHSLNGIFKLEFCRHLITLTKVPRKFSGKVPFKSFIKFFASVFRFSIFWQNNKLACPTTQISPSSWCRISFSVFFNTNVFSLNVLPWKVTFVISSPSNLIFSLVKDLVTLLNLSKVIFPNFFQMCRFMIVKSHPEFNCNSIFLSRICISYFLMFNLSCSSDFVFVSPLLTFLLARQCDILGLTRLQVRHFLFR